MKDILSVLKNRVLIYDGAMGTMLQEQGLVPEQCPEEWDLSHPEKVLAIHRAYVKSGCDIVETNTFGANRLSLMKYGLEDKCYKINYEAVKIAKKASKYVAGSVGPLPEMVSPMGKLSFDEALKIFKEQIEALAGAGSDLIILETFSDIKELKIAVIAARDVCDLPIQAQLTFREYGTTIFGTTPLVAVTVLEGLGVEIIGANCSLGPKELLPVMKQMAKIARPGTFLSVLPNAGMPNIRDGRTYYKITPEEIAEYSRKFLNLGINLLGGCCGTTPEHTRAIAKKIKGEKPVKRKKRKFYLTAASRTHVVEFIPRRNPYIIGERINPSRRKDLAEELKFKKSILIRREAEEQVNNGAHLLDINVGAPEINEQAAMALAVNRVQEVVNVPIVIDSNNPEVIERGLKEYSGKPIVNSVNGEKDKLEKILFLVKKYGAAVIALTMDDKGIPMTAAKRIAIAKKIIKEAVKKGIHREDVLVDFLTLSQAAQPGSAKITLDAVKKSKKLGWQTVLGVSNISFGLPDRAKVNNTFLAMAVKHGLTSAIVNPAAIKLRENKNAQKLLLGKKSLITGIKKKEEGSIEEILYKCVLTGDKDNVVDYVEKYLKENKDPLEINQKILIPALTEVGIRFEKREYFLPQLLLSAEAMQKAVARLEKALPSGFKKEGASILLATVKGDLHDIGKNIVCSVLKNYGYNVIDLGKDVSHDKIIETVNKEKIDIIGLSALMTTTMGQMEVVINELKKKDMDIPTIIGGAVISKSYAEKIGAAGYAKDAIEAVNVVKRILGK